jgi:hypothetical protein
MTKNILKNTTEASPSALLQGLDSVSGFGRMTALNEGKSSRTGSESSTRYNVCQGIQELCTALNVSQSLSAGFGLFGVDEKMTFLKDFSLTTHTLSIVVYASKIFGTQTVTDTGLKDDAKERLQKDSVAFWREYGDAYVSSITTGAEYYAVYAFYAETREEQQSLSADLMASGIFQGGSLDAGFQNKLDEFTKSHTVRHHFDQHMSGTGSTEYPTPEKLIEFALHFPSLPIKEEEAEIISFTSSGYEHVPDVGDFNPIAKNRNYFIGNGPEAGLENDLVKVIELLNLMDRLGKIYTLYDGFTDKKVDDLRKVAEKDREAIKKQLTDYQADPTRNFERPDFPSLTQGTPALTYTLGEMKLGGSGGEDHFDDVNDGRDFMQSLMRISKLQLRWSDYVYALIVTYINEHNQLTEYRHGGTDGDSNDDLVLLKEERIRSVSGRSGRYVDFLKFETSSGKYIEGGGPGGDRSSWTVPDGSFVLGFKGRSGRLLDKVAIVYVTFKEATWNR